MALKAALVRVYSLGSTRALTTVLDRFCSLTFKGRLRTCASANGDWYLKADVITTPVLQRMAWRPAVGSG